MRVVGGKSTKKTRSAFGAFFHQENKVAFATRHYLKVKYNLDPDPTVTPDSILSVAELREYWERVAAQGKPQERSGTILVPGTWRNENSEGKSLVSHSVNNGETTHHP